MLMRTRAEARRAAIDELRAAGIETVVLDADLLLAHVIGGRKEDVYAHPDAPLSEWAEREYARLVARRARGEPVAYLRGVKEFYGLAFVVTPQVLIPRPETEVLVTEVVRWAAARPEARVCDLGTGCGAIAICVAMELPLARVCAVDVTEDALAVARENAMRHDVAERVTFLRGDLLEPLGEVELDAVAANLPYLRTADLDDLRRSSLAYEPRRALDGGPDGLAVIRRVIDVLPRHLASDGAAFFECDPSQAEEVGFLLRRKLRARTRVAKDLAGRDRVVVAERGG